jgi:hypothetical protein
VSEQHGTLDLGEGGVVPLAVAGGGAFAFVLSFILGSRLLRLLGIAAVIGGGGLYARARLAERREKIDEAETRIRSELDDLDPVARAQVLADMARSAI